MTEGRPVFEESLLLSLVAILVLIVLPILVEEAWAALVRAWHRARRWWTS